MWWDEWRGGNQPTMWIKRVAGFVGRRLDLHKFVHPDDPDCFHTHPAFAIRIVIWGGYEEELWGGEKRVLKPGHIGLVRPEMCHRVSKLLNGVASYSIWLRGKVRAEIHLRGNGWNAS